MNVRRVLSTAKRVVDYLLYGARMQLAEIERRDEQVAAMHLYSTRARDVQAAPQKSPDAAQTARGMTGRRTPDGRTS